MRRATFVSAAIVAMLALSSTGIARAELGPIELLSKSTTEQAEFAETPAISADGYYVAFRGEIGGLRGVFREDVASGAIVPVAVGNAYERGAATEAAEASAPSISADGRYVSFTTPAPLDPADDREASSSDVYVADMSSAPPTYQLASALDGCKPESSESPCGLSYANERGSVASGRVALSAGGRLVAFVTRVESDLAGAGTPGGQVAVRNLETDRTTLVSAERDPLSGAMTGRPVGEGAVGDPPGAALSADGTTVAWLGTHLSAQVEMPAGEEPPAYNEPLWRRIGDGAGAPTLRIVGPGAPRFGRLLGTTCDPPPGWFNYNGGIGVDDTPQLSADGDTVALLGAPNGFVNLFLVDMASGAPPRPLTREVPIQEPCEAGELKNLPNAAPITDLAISPDGSRLAFTTSRQQFPLAPPNLVTPPPPSGADAELYLVDREAETDERLTPGRAGEGSVGGLIGASSPSFTADGRTLAFSSSAFNLVAGDANEANDVFMVEDRQPAEPPGKTAVSAGPPPLGPRRPWALTASAVSLPSGAVKVRAIVPAAGTLVVRARGLVGGAGHSRPVAAARRRARSEGTVRVDLVLQHGYRRLASPQRGLSATARLRFHSSYGKPLEARLGVVFHARRKQRHGESR